MTRLRLLAAFVAVAVAGSFAGVGLLGASATEAAALRPSRGGSVTTTEGCTFNTVLGPIYDSTCTVTVTHFAVVDGALTAFGTVNNNVAGVTSTFSAPVEAINGTPLGTASAAVAQQAASCQILDLTLGPLHLDLLGLVIDLNQVHLTITAQQGSGNLLGNLLCAVAGLLDNTGGGGLQGTLQNIANVLNHILAAL